MINYGPWASHQCFNYERYNADLKGIRTNGRKGLERTIVKRLLNSIHRDGDSSNFIPASGDSKVDSRLQKVLRIKSAANSDDVDEDIKKELEGARSSEFDFLTFVSYSGHLNGVGYGDAFGFEQLPANTINSLHFSKKMSTMAEEDYQQLVQYYQHYINFDIYSVDDIPSTNVPTNTYAVIDKKITKFNSIKLLGQKYNSKEATSKRGNVIFAYYKDPTQSPQEHQLRPAEILYFFRQVVSLSDEESGDFHPFKFTFAYVRWFAASDVSLTTFNSLNSSTYANTFLADSFLSILPVHCIHSPAGIYYNILDNYNIIINFHRKITE